MNTAFKRLLSLVPFSMLLCVSAYGGMESASYPYEQGKVFNTVGKFSIDSQQDVRIKLTLNPDGTGRFCASFSNGKRYDGDHFFAKVMLIDATGALIGYGQHKKAMNSSLDDRTNVKKASISIDVPDEVVARIAKVQYEAGFYNEGDDDAFWNEVKDAATLIISESAADGFAILSSGAMEAPSGPLSL